MVENIARAKGIELPVATKQAIEVCDFIRGRSVEKAKELLKNVIALKTAVPYRRFKRDIPHRKGKIGPGRFPVKAAKEVLAILCSAESNAENIGLKTDRLVVANAIANRGATVWRSGRKRRRMVKRTHIEIIVKEKEEKGQKPLEETKEGNDKK